MKLYVVTTSYDYGTFRGFEGVFTSVKKAQNFVDKYVIASDHTEIREVELDSDFGYAKETKQGKSHETRIL